MKGLRQSDFIKERGSFWLMVLEIPQSWSGYAPLVELQMAEPEAVQNITGQETGGVHVSLSLSL